LSWSSGLPFYRDWRIVEDGAGSAVQGADAVVERVAQDDAAPEAKSTRKLSEREEAMVALGGHFQELASLLRGVHTRMDDKLGRLVEAAMSMHQMPALANQQLELLRAVTEQVERQNQVGEKIAAAVSGLPELMGKVDTALQRAARSDERAVATMREFQSTMDRMHAAMGRMAESSELQARATQSMVQARDESMQRLSDNMDKSHREAVQELQQMTDQSLESLRRTHEDQSNRLQRVVEEHAGWNKAVLVAVGVVGLLTSALLLVQLFR
jgi:uncharacterized phage infection (PIP) family protein YhgE